MVCNIDATMWLGGTMAMIDIKPSGLLDVRFSNEREGQYYGKSKKHFSIFIGDVHWRMEYCLVKTGLKTA